MKKIQRTAAKVGAAAIAMSAFAVLAAPAASAAPGRLTVCSRGAYASYVEFPGRGGMTTALVNPGICLTADFPDNRGEETLNVYATVRSSTVWLATGHYNAGRGGTVTTYGKASNASDAWVSLPS